MLGNDTNRFTVDTNDTEKMLFTEAVRGVDIEGRCSKTDHSSRSRYASTLILTFIASHYVIRPESAQRQASRRKERTVSRQEVC